MIDTLIILSFGALIVSNICTWIVLHDLQKQVRENAYDLRVKLYTHAFYEKFNEYMYACFSVCEKSGCLVSNDYVVKGKWSPAFAPKSAKKKTHGKKET